MVDFKKVTDEIKSVTQDAVAGAVEGYKDSTQTVKYIVGGVLVFALVMGILYGVLN